MTGWGGGCVTAHQQPHWFLWVSGLTCKTEPLAFPSRPLPSLLHQRAPSAGKLSEGLFSRMGSENSALFVLAAVSFPVEEAGCPEDWGWASWGPRGGRRWGGWGVGVPVWVPFKQGARATPAGWVSAWRPCDRIPPLCFLLW